MVRVLSQREVLGVVHELRPLGPLRVTDSDARGLPTEETRAEMTFMQAAATWLIGFCGGASFMSSLETTRAARRWRESEQDRLSGLRDKA